MADFEGWLRLSEHLTTQQRVQLKAELDVANGDNTTLVHQMDNGWSVRKLNHQGDFTTEGRLMDNCIGGYGPESGYHDVHSLRDENNLPYVSFQMRRRTTEDHGGYGAWSRSVGVGEQDTGKDVLTTTQVLGRNNEDPKDSYGVNLVKGLSGIAKAEGIPHVSWNRGPLKSPQDLDDFVDREENASPPNDVYLKVPVGLKSPEGGVNFKGEEHGSAAWRNIQVSEEPFEPQFGFHIFKTPFSDKRFDKEQSLGTRLNESVGGGGYKIRHAPGDPYKAVSEGLKPSQVNLVHEAQTPEHVYVKMRTEDYVIAKDSCDSCKGTGKEGADKYSRTPCTNCGGDGRGTSFAVASGRNSYRGDVEASPDLSDFEEQQVGEVNYRDMDHHVVKVPFREANFDFNAGSGKYAVSKDGPSYDSKDAELVHKAHVPRYLYVGVPSKERNNRYVYSEDGLEGHFLRNQDLAASPTRSNFVGAKGNDILRVDTSKLDEDHLAQHRQDYPGQRQRRYNQGRVDLWKLNTTKPIPYEAITNVNAAIDFADVSEQNKRKKPITPEPVDIHNPKLIVKWPSPPDPEFVSFQTGLTGRPISAIKTLEAGHLSKDVGTGVANLERTGGDASAKVKYDRDVLTEITPTLSEIRSSGGRIERDGINSRFDYEHFPKNRFFKLNQDLEPGHGAMLGLNLAPHIEEKRQQGGSVIPDEGYVHVPRFLRGNEDLYSEKGIDLSKIQKEGRGGERSAIKGLGTIYDKPIEGGPGDMESGEDPHEMDVWAVDLNKVQHATYNPRQRPYTYYAQDKPSLDAYNIPTDDDGKQVVPWEAITKLHRKPEEPTAPSIRRFFNTANAHRAITGWKHLTLIK